MPAAPDWDFTAGLKTERMTDLALSFKKSGAMIAAIDLGLFTAIAEGADTVTKIADRIALDEEKVDRLVTVCKTMQLVHETDGRLANYGDADRYLVKGRRTYFGDYLAYMVRRDYEAWLDITKNLTTPSTQPDRRTYVHYDADEARRFTVAGYEASLPLGHKLAKEFDFGRFRHWLDLGGGSGCYAIAACERHAGFDVTVMDLPNVVPITREFVAKHGLESRITAIEGNFFDADYPRGCDLASFITPLQVYMPHEIVGLLRKTFAALEPGGTILAIEYMLNDEKTGPADPAFINLFGIRGGKYIGRVNTGAEWQSFMREAGFVEPEVRWFTPNQLGLITARKPG